MQRDMCSFLQAFFKRDCFVISSKKIYFGNHYAGTFSETIASYFHDQVGLKYLDREKPTLSVTKGYHCVYSHVLLLVFKLSLFDISSFIQVFFFKMLFLKFFWPPCPYNNADSRGADAFIFDA